jgi:D-glycero-D-manno-heptose 1,7-bisphosphate phosphatase
VSAPLPPPPIVDDASARMLSAAPRAALFLDRDGVINVDRGYVHTIDNTVWLPGIFELVAEAGDAGLSCVIVTNQAGIARGYYAETDFLAYTQWMHSEFRKRGAPILATYYCPHHPEAGIGDFRAVCTCRKPAPGMMLAAISDFGFDPDASVMIGDKPWDAEAARSAGISKSFLVADADLSTARRWLANVLEN